MKCRNLSKIFRDKEVIIDDGSYADMSGNAGYYTSDNKQKPDSVKLKRVAKYEQNLLVWVAISKNTLF